MKYESMRMSTFVFFVSIVLWQFHVPLGAQRTPSAFEIHQRFQVESGFHFVSGNQSSLFFQPSEDFPEEVVPTDSSGYSVLDTWSDDKINSPQVRHIRELLKVGKGGEALPLLLELTRLYPEVTPYRLWLAEAYFLEWNHFKANEILDYLLKHYPLYSFPYQIKAEIHLRKKEYEEALEWAAKARVLQAAHPKIIGTFESVASRGGYKMTVKLLRPNYRITKEANRFVVTSDPL
jgi:tetratricopeptide (TPR) repeat protein